MQNSMPTSSRQRVANYLGAVSADEIVFTRGTTESINLVAQAWGGKFLRAGDVVLLTEMEHHSNLVPARAFASSRCVMTALSRSNSSSNC